MSIAVDWEVKTSNQTNKHMYKNKNSGCFTKKNLKHDWLMMLSLDGAVVSFYHVISRDFMV